MSRIGLLLCTTSLGASAQAFAVSNSAPQPLTFKDEAKSSVVRVQDAQGVVTRTTNVTYGEATAYIKGALRFGVIMRTTVQAERASSMEGAKSTLTLNAYVDSSGTPAVSMTMPGDKLSFAEPFYVEAVEYGCCASPDKLALFDYGAAQPFLVAEGYYATVEVPNTKTRAYAGFTALYERNELRVGRLRFVAADGGVVGAAGQELDVRTKSKAAFEQAEGFFELSLRPHALKDQVHGEHKAKLQLWSQNSKAGTASIDNFSIVVRLDATEDKANALWTLVVPVINGKLFGKADAVQTVTVGP